MATKKAKKSAPKKKAPAKKIVQKSKPTSAKSKPVEPKALEPVAASNPPATSSNEDQNATSLLVKLLVLIGIAIIIYVAYAKITGKAPSTAKEMEAKKIAEEALKSGKEKAEQLKNETTEKIAEGVTKAKEEVNEIKNEFTFQFSKVGKDKTWKESVDYCKSINGSLPTVAELKDLIKTGSELKTGSVWASNEEGAKKALFVNLANGKAALDKKTSKHLVLCK